MLKMVLLACALFSIRIYSAAFCVQSFFERTAQPTMSLVLFKNDQNNFVTEY